MRRAEIDSRSTGLFDAVLFDRDNTLIRDVPRLGDPDLVVPMPGVRAALDLLREAGLRIGVVSHQSAVGFGFVTRAQAEAVDARIAALLGPFDTWQTCWHTPADGCACRKPSPGLITAAARDLGISPHRCVMVGDLGTDLQAAAAAGATGLLVPTGQTCVAEAAAAPYRAPSLLAAAEWILARGKLLRPGPAGADEPGNVLAVRAGSAGDVLLTGPALRALAARAHSVSLLTGPPGVPAGRLLPGVTRVLEWRTPWAERDPAPVDRSAVDGLIDTVRCWQIDEAVIFTSSAQSPLPTALLLRLAGVGRISAVCEDYPGALLDVRHRVPDDLPEAHRALSLAAAAGYRLPDGDDGRLRTVLPDARTRTGRVVVHPGASASARGLPRKIAVEIVRELALSGREVLVTGGPDETELTAEVAGDVAGDLGGLTDLAALGRLLAGSACLVVGNTGPAHLAAAVGTPVVSMFAPTVPFARWGPHGVPHVRLGDPDAPCRDTRALTCAQPGHPCLGEIDPAEVVAAVDLLARTRP
ncbi:HAD-IIIA family hydrolase [Catellatospora vulcania]|uniref:HAD-IIIA family hydrolase n=1 Tax=Catellatospora vulcania TaxID=1460450 RepID=UPI001E39D4D1|nr:HAD-IIIA family hydrolase [Catellatospora vulcania]